MNWHVIRVAYFEKNKTNIVLNGIQPALSHLENDNMIRCYITRHWKFGPHIDICIQVKNTDLFKQDYNTFSQQLAKWLVLNPSTTVLDEQQYNALSVRLGKAELDAGPYKPLLKNNSITLSPYDNPIELFGGEGMLQVKQNFQHQFKDFLFPLLEIKQQSHTKFIDTLVEMFACIANTYSFEKIKKGHLSLRSHVEYFLANYDKNDQLKNKLDSLQQQHSEAADKSLHRTIFEFNQLSFYKGNESFFRDWVLMIFNARAQITDEVLNNFAQIQNPNRINDYAQKHIAKGPDDKYIPKQGKFFDKFSEKDRDSLFSKPEFIIYRTLVNQFYVSLLSLGVSPVEKHLLCEIVSKATERYFDLDWQKQLNSSVTTAIAS